MKPHWSVRAAAIAGIPWAILMGLFGAFITFALLFNGHPALAAGAVHFVVSALCFAVDIGVSIALLAGWRRATLVLLIVNAVQLVAVLAFVVACLLIGDVIEPGLLLMWIGFALVPVRLLVFALGLRAPK
jgi:hypothetical protein